MNKLLIGIGAFVGSMLGSYVPVLWGGSLLGLASVLLGTVGGIVGIIMGYRLSKFLGFI
ncbi:hypothetical protein [Nodosilinea nodulosa]|uniref:hypothetical protein n=1 Tax=Nodosilinea nodulosa TaxID=416001 RepID=UPI0002D57356|nr:hypothetical protein [Nodosilinea nodulosa]